MIYGVDIHPFAEAVLVYFTVDGRAAASQLEPAAFLEQLFAAIDRFPAREVAPIADDLLAAARFLEIYGRPTAARMVAEHLERSSRRAMVRAGGVALLAGAAKNRPRSHASGARKGREAALPRGGALGRPVPGAERAGSAASPTTSWARSV